MNFDEIYKKIQTGTASEEEKSYFNSEIEKIRKISSILEEDKLSMPSDNSPVIKEADIDTVQKARKSFNLKILWKVIIIAVASSLLIAAIVCGIIFIPSITSARRCQNYTPEQAIEIAKDCLASYTGEDINNFYIHDFDRELDIRGRLSNSVYLYEIDFKNKTGDKYEITVNADSGYAVVTDVHIHH